MDGLRGNWIGICCGPFSEIVRAGGVSRTADRLCMKQPSVSLALKRLEQSLGVVLCTRGPGGFELTEEGVFLSGICDRMNKMVSGIPPQLASMRREVFGQIRLHVISGMVNSTFDRAIEFFHRRYPKVEIAIEVSTWDAIRRSLIRHEADIGVAPACYSQNQLLYRPLFRERHRPYCGRPPALRVWSLCFRSSRARLHLDRCG